MSYEYDRTKAVSNAINANPKIFQEILNARLGGLSVKFMQSSAYSSLTPKDNNTLYLVARSANEIWLYKGSTRIALNGDKSYNHAIIIYSMS